MSKLDSGGGPLATMVDLYAATIVVPTSRDIEAVSQALDLQFDLRRRADRSIALDQFRYDDLHVIAKLGGKVAPSAVPKIVREREFEIQIKTGLQYAWWKATHDQIYKANSVTASAGARLKRLESGTRAAIESLDNQLSDLQGAAKLQFGLSDDNSEMRRLASAEALLLIWPTSRRPSDVLSFSRTIVRLAEMVDVPLEDLGAWLASTDMMDVVMQNQITPAGAVTICLVRYLKGQFSDRLSAAEASVLVTSEMIELCPELAALPQPCVSGP